MINTVPLEAVRYDSQTGLVPVVVQDAATHQVLMQAYANREALKRTLGTGQAWFWSRSRQEYWHKGATSGNVMVVNDIKLDCDGDSVLYLVSPAGPACHTGETSCFFRTIAPKSAVDSGAVNAVDADAAAGDAKPVDAGGAQAGAQAGAEAGTEEGAADASTNVDASIISRLWQTIEARYRDRPQGAYTTYLFEHGVDKIAKKVGEEAVEVALAAKNAMTGSAGKSELASESADLLYHLLALWKQADITPDDVFQVLRERHR
ncbi:bifunctional phosphoribosyl-AMP cyclohydrolase/phosphoribosyl-ATP diphosphatase HisIE [Alicyclobacillus curvatus]|nr:bifunctional phosphoribosyl-AMP cyclohydrolase/phosphoribosyl-ATP diphosphatase HisIE [Alicyclobacillus curvatus]